MLKIKVLGPGCANCQRLETLTKAVISEMAMDAEVIKVTDYADIMKYPILSTPGLVVNEKVVVSGRVPTKAEITTFLANAMMEV